jgi:aryl-alcohol dehydrogenase-like predicted oxidoreductase
MKRDPFPLPIRRLGRTDLQVTGIGLGGAGIGGGYGEVSDADAIETVQRAVEWGVNYIDTSPLYGDSERRIGQALKGSRRNHVILSTKTGTHPERRGDYSWDATMWSVENSLKLLKTSYLELVYVHDPAEMEPVFARRGALEALESLKEQEVIGGIGLGQRRHDFHRQAIESGRFDVILTYNDYHPLRASAADTLLPLARHHDVGTVNGSPLAHGLLIGQDPDALPEPARRRFSEADLAAARRFHDWCAAREVPMVAAALQFCLRQDLIDCTLTGAKTPAELEENLRFALMPLSPNIWEELPLAAGAP